MIRSVLRNVCFVLSLSFAGIAFAADEEVPVPIDCVTENGACSQETAGQNCDDNNPAKTCKVTARGVCVCAS